LTPAEREQLLAEWRAAAPARSQKLSLERRIAEHAAARPDAVAIVADSTEVTWSELDRRAGRLAARLRELGVGPDVRVAVCLGRSADLIVALLSVLKAGGAYVPLDPAYPGEHLAWLLADCGAPVLLTEERLAPGLPAAGREVVCLDREPQPPEAAAAGPVPEAGADHLAYAIYTSGTSGRPKGVLVPRGAFAGHCLDAAARFGLGEQDVVLQFSSLSFDAAQEQVFPALLAGARLRMRGEELWSPSRLAAEIGRAGVTVADLPLAYWRRAVERWSDEEVQRVRGSLRLVIVGGEPLTADDVRRWRRRGLGGVGLLHAYGPTEATITATWHEAGEADAAPSGPSDLVPIGRCLPGRRAALLDRDGQLVPAGVTGELYLGGLGVARGYLGRPEATAERFVPDPWSPEPGGRLYRTGDLARRRADGAIEFLGRADEQVKVRGFRVEPAEIEAVLAQHPAVASALVVARQEADGDRRLVAYVVPRGDAPGDSELLAFLRRRLPEHMVPSAVVALEAFPLTPAGKVDRRALPAPFAPRPLAEAAQPRGDLERRIATIWRDVLGVEQVGLADNFFDLGGHSLRLLEVQDRLARELGREMPVVDLFRFPTVGALARHLAAGEAAAEVPQAASRQTGATAAAVFTGPADIAVVGLAGRFPGAAGIEDFWRNLRDGVEAVSFFSDEELAATGIPASLLADPRYVKARAVLEGADLFDAAFFDFSPREAEIMDPQQRVLLETAWEALENAGYDAHRYPGAVGVFCGAASATYLWNNLASHPDLLASMGTFQVLIGNDRDHLATHISYKLDLRGPALNVQTACSTSLVAVASAVQSLQNYQCDMALAGGISITLPQKRGYLHQEG
ncbi:MAG TPA: amino acid adenylation domain-containing protein, partial [Thermoanaerobaculia bacterium]|nr:amino acid adenylation domain-containing protein [Thermoanaerobaculia bacterium]